MVVTLAWMSRVDCLNLRGVRVHFPTRSLEFPCKESTRRNFTRISRIVIRRIYAYLAMFFSNLARGINPPKCNPNLAEC